MNWCIGRMLCYGVIQEIYVPMSELVKNPDACQRRFRGCESISLCQRSDIYPVTQFRSEKTDLNQFEQKQVFMFSEQYLAAWLVELL